MRFFCLVYWIQLPLFSGQGLWRWSQEGPEVMFQAHGKSPWHSGSIIQRPVTPIHPKVLEYYTINFSFLPNTVWAKFLSPAIRVPELIHRGINKICLSLRNLFSTITFKFLHYFLSTQLTEPKEKPQWLELLLMTIQDRVDEEKVAGTWRE